MVEIRKRHDEAIGPAYVDMKAEEAREIKMDGSMRAMGGTLYCFATDITLCL